MSLQEEYINQCSIPSDINEHLSLLYELAKECKHCTEFGVGYARSTRAFAAAMDEVNGTLHSYEFHLLDGVSGFFEQAKHVATLHLQNILDSEIEETDLLLVDSHHTYDQVKQELAKFGDKVRKYIVFHDVELYGLSGQDPGSVGIWPAINEWMDSHPQWKIKEHRYNNNGLLVVEK